MNRLEQLKTIPGEQISFFGEKGKTAKTKNTLSYPSLFFERVTDIIWGPQLAVEDKGKEQQRLFYREGEVVQVRKMVLDSQEPEIYLKMLLDDIAHFTGVMEKTENGEFRPPTIEEFKKKLRKSKAQAVVGLDEQGAILGCAFIDNEASIRWFVVAKEYQNKKHGVSTGKTFINKLLDWAFFERKPQAHTVKIQIGAELPRWEKPRELFESAGFILDFIFPSKVEVYVPKEEKLPDEEEVPFENRVVRPDLLFYFLPRYRYEGIVFLKSLIETTDIGHSYLKKLLPSNFDFYSWLKGGFEEQEKRAGIDNPDASNQIRWLKKGRSVFSEEWYKEYRKTRGELLEIIKRQTSTTG